MRHGSGLACLIFTLTAACQEPPPAAPSIAGGEMWGSSYFPNVELTAHTGEKVRFFDDLIKDKVVAVNFIYTKCTDACPMETARMTEVARLLGDRLGKDVFFYSISIDPRNDTPEALADYARRWKVGPGWTFLTGTEEDVTLLRKKLGVYEKDLALKDHNLSLLIGNQKTGRWMKRSPYENPYVLANQLGSWLHNWQHAPEVERSYADAPEVRNISKGEDFFRTRCASCHTIGGGKVEDGERFGPDLLDVAQRRDAAWLTRWIIEPDKMLAEKEPTAMALFAEWKDMPMPNLRLTAVDAANVLVYIDEESQRVRRARDVPAAGAARLAPGAKAAIEPMLLAYDALQMALAKDDHGDAKAAAAKLAAAAASPQLASVSSGAGPRFKLVAGHAAELEASPTIEAARRAFGDISRNVIVVLVDNEELRTGRHLFLCPMTEGYQRWVQSTSTLQNPYWGARMLTCGQEVSAWAS